MILVTGAAGKTGKAVIQALSKRNVPVRALVHRPDQVDAMRRLGVQEIIVGDMRSPASMQRACRGVHSIYHICPNVSPDEQAIGRTVLAAAQEAGVRHLVYHSVLHPQVEAMPHHWQKMRVEEQIFASGLPFTILQPAPYMQNILPYWQSMIEEGRYAVPYAPTTPLTHVDLADVGEAAAIALTEPGHIGAVYELCSADTLTPNEIAATVERHCGRRIEVQTVPLDVWQAQAKKRGMGEYQVQTLSRMFSYYENHGLIGNERVLHCLLQRPPRTFDAFVQQLCSASFAPPSA